MTPDLDGQGDGLGSPEEGGSRGRFRRPLWYGLDGNPIDAESAEALLGDGDARRVALTRGDFGVVSTVFLVLDHNPFGEGPPLLWETMWFGRDGYDVSQMRTSNRVAALAAHDQMVSEAREFYDRKR